MYADVCIFKYDAVLIKGKRRGTDEMPRILLGSRGDRVVVGIAVVAEMETDLATF